MELLPLGCALFLLAVSCMLIWWFTRDEIKPTTKFPVFNPPYPKAPQRIGREAVSRHTTISDSTFHILHGRKPQESVIWPGYMVGEHRPRRMPLNARPAALLLPHHKSVTRSVSLHPPVIQSTEDIASDILTASLVAFEVSSLLDSSSNNNSSVSDVSPSFDSGGGDSGGAGATGTWGD